jgi:thioredoxin reductase
MWRGADPTGFAAAVYVSAEGLRTVVVAREAIGGQARARSMIRKRGMGWSSPGQREVVQPLEDRRPRSLDVGSHVVGSATTSRIVTGDARV